MAIVPVSLEQQEDLLLSTVAQLETSTTLDILQFPSLQEPILRTKTRTIYGPVPNRRVAKAVSLWLDAHGSSNDELYNGKALIKCLQDIKDPGGFRKRLEIFRRHCERIDMAVNDIPTAKDLQYARNIPRVFAAIARVAEAVDTEAWSFCMQQAGVESVGNWRDVMLNETWDGDDIARALVALFGDCCIVVAGSQGSGKSATISTILGRHCVPHSHPLRHETPDSKLDERSLFHRKKLRHLRYLNWPTFPIDSQIPIPNLSVDYIHVKVDNHVVSAVELPSMEDIVYGIDDAGGMSTVRAGDFIEVLSDLQGETPSIAIVVERLDDINVSRFRRNVHRLQRIFGRIVFSRLLVILTHGHSLPGCGMSYDVWAFDQKRKIREVLEKLTKGLPEVPIIVIENSEHCYRDASGVRLLPDGSDFVESLTEKIESVGKQTTVGRLVPMPTSRWWERYAIFFGIALLLSRIT